MDGSNGGGGDGSNNKNSNNNANGSGEDSQTDGNGSDKNGNGNGSDKNNNGGGSGANNGNGSNKNGPGGPNNGNGNYDTPWPNEWLESAEESGPASSGSKGSPDDERRRRKPGPGPNNGGSLGVPSLSNALPCPERYIGFMEFPGRCDVYTLCTFGIRVLFECAPGLHFDKGLKTCNFIQLANCGGPSAPIPQLGRSNGNATVRLLSTSSV